MSGENSDGTFRRTVLTTIAGAGTAGVVGAPALAATGDRPSDEEYPRGPVTVEPTGHTGNQLTYDELGKVLGTGDVTVVDGDVRNERIYVGEDRNVSVEEIEERFSDIGREATTQDADSGTWVVDCRTIPIINKEVCTKVTFNVYTWGVEVDLIVYGYPVWGGGIGYSDGAVDFKFNVPVLPVKGDATLGASQLGGCDANIEAEVSFKVSGWKIGPFGGSHPVEYC